MTDISIIVPIYNAEKYIEETIKSIIGQTLKNIEIILVRKFVKSMQILIKELF